MPPEKKCIHPISPSAADVSCPLFSRPSRLLSFLIAHQQPHYEPWLLLSVMCGPKTPATTPPHRSSERRVSRCNTVHLSPQPGSAGEKGRYGRQRQRQWGGVGWGRGDVRLRRHVWSLSPGRQMWPWSPLPAASSPLHPPPTSPDIPSCSPGPHAAGVADGPPRDTESQRD